MSWKSTESTISALTGIAGNLCHNSIERRESMVIYIDVLLFVNAIVNYAILMTAEKLLKRDVRLYRMILGAVIGAIFSLTIFISSDSRILLLILRIVTTGIITLIVFGWRSSREYLKSYLCNTVVSIIYCGAYILFYQVFMPPNMVIVNDILYLQVNPLWLTALTAIIYIIVLIIYKIFSERIKSTVVTLKFTIHGKDCSCVGKVDTGSNLREPFSSAPVIIVDTTVFDTAGEELIRVIPYSTVNGSSYLSAVKADTVHIDKKPISETIYIASGHIQNPNYQAIINSEIIR